tara:strand:- start:74 stop:1090 length:1017 start_codon:yes stop_codon:yes gene_type:complete
MKLIKHEIIEPILYRYPNKVSIKNINIYNNNSDNNVLFNQYSSYFILKPKGKKAYIWFTYIEKKLLAILIFLNNKNIYHYTNEFFELPVQFHNELCYNNTLLFGYYFTNITNNNKNHYFIIENIFNYNIYNKILQKNDYNHNFNYKLQLFHIILPKIINANNFFIKLPIILNDNDNLFKLIHKLDYKIFSINVYSDSKYLGYYNFNSKDTLAKISATFKITPCINQDLYNLYILNKDKEEFYDLALIDTFKTSVFMNKLFRNIKENYDLDKLEESDSEEEFQNINIDKYVYLEKSYIIDCEYNNKFKKWIPKNLSKNNIITKNNLQLILAKKKYYYNV